MTDELKIIQDQAETIKRLSEVIEKLVANGIPNSITDGLRTYLSPTMQPLPCVTALYAVQTVDAQPASASVTFASSAFSVSEDK